MGNFGCDREGGPLPYAKAYDSASGNVLVANMGSHTVSVISGSTQALVATVVVGSGPQGAVFDPAQLRRYFANYNSGTVSVISGVNYSVVPTVNVGSHPSAIAFDSTNGEIYVAHFGSSTVSVIEPSAKTASSTTTKSTATSTVTTSTTPEFPSGALAIVPAASLAAVGFLSRAFPPRWAGRKGEYLAKWRTRRSSQPRPPPISHAGRSST